MDTPPFLDYVQLNRGRSTQQLIFTQPLTVFGIVMNKTKLNVVPPFPCEVLLYPQSTEYLPSDFWIGP